VNIKTANKYYCRIFLENLEIGKFSARKRCPRCLAYIGSTTQQKKE